LKEEINYRKEDSKNKEEIWQKRHNEHENEREKMDDLRVNIEKQEKQLEQWQQEMNQQELNNKEKSRKMIDHEETVNELKEQVKQLTEEKQHLIKQ